MAASGGGASGGGRGGTVRKITLLPHREPWRVRAPCRLSERCRRDEFRGHAEGPFSRGQGWTYLPRVRDVQLGPDGRTAWFHELLDSASYGLTRGTGVLVLEDGTWRIAQYHLTIPVPNELARDVVEMITRHGGST